MPPDLPISLSSTGSPVGNVLGVIVAIALLGLVIRLIAGAMDRTRIERYINSAGGHLLECSWTPFGPGWFGEKDSRIYQIVYRDRGRRVHRAHAKTSVFSGVYLTKDVVIREADGYVPSFDGRPQYSGSEAHRQKPRSTLVYSGPVQQEPIEDTGAVDGAAAPVNAEPPKNVADEQDQQKALLEENARLRARIRELEDMSAGE